MSNPWDNWTIDDFRNELLAQMEAGLFSDVNAILDMETRLENGELTEEDKKKIAYQNI